MNYISSFKRIITSNHNSYIKSHDKSKFMNKFKIFLCIEITSLSRH